MKRLDLSEEQAVARLAKMKCLALDPKNHQTGWNALKKLKNPHKDNLRRMGYRARRLARLNFEIKFEKDNGAKGKLPVTLTEWFPEH